MKKNKKIVLLIILIFTIYLISITTLIKNNKCEINEPIYKIYMIKNNKEKYEKILKDDLIEFDINNVLELTNNQNINEISNQKFDINTSQVLFDCDSNEDIFQNEIYAICEMTSGDIICKNNIVTYEDLIKEKMLNYSFLGYISYEIPYAKKIKTNDQIELEEKDSYKEILNEFSISNECDVKVYIQNKDTYEIIKIIDCGKLVYINEEKAIVCLLPEQAKLLKENINNGYILISKYELLDMEVYTFE